MMHKYWGLTDGEILEVYIEETLMQLTHAFVKVEAVASTEATDFRDRIAVFEMDAVEHLNDALNEAADYALEIGRFDLNEKVDSTLRELLEIRSASRREYQEKYDHGSKP